MADSTQRLSEPKRKGDWMDGHPKSKYVALFWSSKIKYCTSFKLTRVKRDHLTPRLKRGLIYLRPVMQLS